MPEHGGQPLRLIGGSALLGWLALIAGLALLVGACAFGDGTSGHSSKPTGAIPALPTPGRSSPGPPATPLMNGMFRSQAQSVPTEHGRLYRYELYTHCGLARSNVDVDGSFWVPVESGPDGDPPAGFRNPTDLGTVVIPVARPDRLVYTSASGIETPFRRGSQEAEFLPCAEVPPRPRVMPRPGAQSRSVHRDAVRTSHSTTRRARGT